MSDCLKILMEISLPGAISAVAMPLSQLVPLPGTVHKTRVSASR
jgi:hypothetical protein